MRGSLFAYTAVLLTAAGLMASEKAKVQSGLQPGDMAGAFNVLDCTGPNKGKTLCYR